MKTKAKTLIAICALATIGLINVSAIADNKGLVNADVVLEAEESLTIEDWMLDERYWETEKVVITPEQDDTLQIESWMTDASLWK